jgi:DNA-binding transcriptional regulator GbsR (MarR family)
LCDIHDEERWKYFQVSDDLYNLQNTAQAKQHHVDQLVDDTKNVRRIVEKSRGSQKRHPDVEKLEDEVHRTTARWTNTSSQIVDRYAKFK